MDSLFITLHKTALDAEGGITGLASRLVVRQQTMINKLNPDDEASEPKISEFVRIMKDTGDTAPLDELCRMFGGKFVSRSCEKSGNLLAAILHANSEHGELSLQIEDALSDNEISADEMVSLSRQMQNIRLSIESLENTLRDKHEKAVV